MQLQQACEPRASWGKQSRAAGEAQHNRLPQGTAGLHGLSLPPATPAKALLALAQFVPGLSLWPELNSAHAGHQHSGHHLLTVHAMSWQQDMVIGTRAVASWWHSVPGRDAAAGDVRAVGLTRAEQTFVPSTATLCQLCCLLGQLLAVLELSMHRLHPCQGGMQ